MSFPTWLTEAFNVQDAIDELKKQKESLRQANSKLWNEKRENANKVTELRRIMRELKDSNALEQTKQAKTISQLTFETEMQAEIIDDQHRGRSRRDQRGRRSRNTSHSPARQRRWRPPAAHPLSDGDEGQVAQGAWQGRRHARQGQGCRQRCDGRVGSQQHAGKPCHD